MRIAKTNFEYKACGVQKRQLQCRPKSLCQGGFDRAIARTAGTSYAPAGDWRV